MICCNALSEGTSQKCRVTYCSATDFSTTLVVTSPSVRSFSLVFGCRTSDFKYRCLNWRLLMKRGAPKSKCMHSSCVLTSAIDWRLNQRSMAEPVPCLFSSAFSMQREKECSMTPMRAPWPDLVIYFVMYSMTASLDKVAWKSMLDSMASMTVGTKLFKKWQFLAIQALYKSRLRGSSATSS